MPTLWYSANTVTDGEILWNPVQYLDRLLSDNYDPKHRAAAFFVSLGFAYSSCFSCSLENCLPAESYSLASLSSSRADGCEQGNDIAALWPQYMSIRRGELHT